jgi:glycosyltransferase involved in cell wall biosynthesis
LRILLVIEPSGGGSGRHVINLAAALIVDGHQVSLVWSPTRADAWFAAEVAALGLRTVETLPMRRAVGPWDLPALLALNRLIARLGPFDIVHGHSAKAGALVRLAYAPGAARIYTPHALMMMKPKGLSRRVAGVVEFLLAHAGGDALIAGSAEEARVARRWRLGRRRIHVIPNGLAVMPSTDRSAARRMLGARQDDRVLGFVGRLCAQKDPVRFARAVRIANAADPRVTGIMIGAGELAAQVQAEGGAAIRLLGARNARAMMAGFDLFAMTSLYEACSYAMTEAAVLGLPLVTTDVGGIDPLEQAGARIDRLPRDATPEHLAEAMLAALHRRVARQPLSDPILAAHRMAKWTIQVYRDAFTLRRLGG